MTGFLLSLPSFCKVPHNSLVLSTLPDHDPAEEWNRPWTFSLGFLLCISNLSSSFLLGLFLHFESTPELISLPHGLILQ